MYEHTNNLKNHLLKALNISKDGITIHVREVNGKNRSFVLSSNQILFHLSGNHSNQSRDFAMQSVFVTESLLRHLHSLWLSLLFQNKESFDKDETNLRFLLVDILRVSGRMLSHAKSGFSEFPMMLERRSSPLLLTTVRQFWRRRTSLGSKSKRLKIPELPETLSEALEKDELNANQKEELKVFFSSFSKLQSCICTKTDKFIWKHKRNKRKSQVLSRVDHGEEEVAAKKKKPHPKGTRQEERKTRRRVSRLLTHTISAASE